MIDCVSIETLVAAFSLGMLRRPCHEGAFLEAAAFTIPLHARTLGCAAETDDHTNRGRNMDALPTA